MSAHRWPALMAIACEDRCAQPHSLAALMVPPHIVANLRVSQEPATVALRQAFASVETNFVLDNELSRLTEILVEFSPQTRCHCIGKSHRQGSMVMSGAQAEFDRFFGVRRVAGTAECQETAYASSLLFSYRNLLESATQGMSHVGTLPVIKRAYVKMASMACGFTSQPGEINSIRTSSATGARADSACCELRWQVGHHSFFCLCQGAIKALTEYSNATARTDWSAAQRGLDTAADIFVGAAAAMHFSVDLPEHDYDNVLVPRMERWLPPLSGAMSLDHQALIRLLRPRQLPCPTKRNEVPWTRFERALASLLDTHVLVCKKVGGDRRASIATKSATAVEELDSLARRRLKDVRG